MSELLEKIMRWARLKITLHEKLRPQYGKEREVWWVHLGANVRDEEDGKHDGFERPAVIVSRFFGGKMLWVVPMTTSPHEGSYYVRAEHADESGKPVTHFAIVPQMRAISYRRLHRKIGKFSAEDFHVLIARITDFLPN